MLDLQKLVAVFKEHKGIGFIAFPYINKQNELSKRLVNIGFSYENAVKKDLETLNEGIEYIPSEKYTQGDWDVAVTELKKSCIKSLYPNNTDARSTGQIEAYIHLANGLRWHIESKTLHIYGLSVRKTTVEEGGYKEVKSAPKTIAKNTIKSKYLRASKLRTFPVQNLAGNIKINGDTIEVD